MNFSFNAKLFCWNGEICVFSDDDDDDEDDAEALMAELERIKKERAEEKLRKVGFIVI